MIRYQPAKLPSFRAAISLPELSNRPLSSSYGRMTASASDGIFEVLMSSRSRGRVLIPAYTCSRVAYAVVAVGDKPVFIDVDPSSGSFDDRQLRRELGQGAKAIILTHLFGWNEQFDAHCRLALYEGAMVIEDSALVLTAWDLRREMPSARVVSFGRGKPLPLGGGGAIHFSDESLRADHCKWLRAADWRANFTYRSLWLGALKDSRISLQIARAALRFRAHKGGLTSTALHDDFAPRQLSLYASKSLEHGLLGACVRKVVDVNRAALEHYRNSLTGTHGAMLESLGRRVAGGLASPVVALRCRPPDRPSVLTDLVAKGVDCPRYWEYCLGEDMSRNGFPGARHLADSLLFLPLHGGVDALNAREVALSLRRHRLDPFS